MTGISMMCLLGEENALAANGSVLYMMNHSLVKLTLFLFAGVVYYNCHALDLNDIKGFGRGKPWLHGVFLCGACSLAGIPGFCGYISKTLVHESIVEYAEMSGSLAISAVEWLFLFSGGLTAAYLTKIYVAVFWQEGRQTDKNWGTLLSRCAVTVAAITLPVIGLLPHALAERITGTTLNFTAGHAIHHAVRYSSLTNLKGVAISLTIGMLVYFLFIRKVLMDKDGNYLYKWPTWLNMEENLYKPVLRALVAVLNVLARAVCDLPDALILLVRRTVLQDVRPAVRRSPFSPAVELYSRNKDVDKTRVADLFHSTREAVSRMAGSLSFALLMTCLGVCTVLVVVICHVF